MSLIENKLQIRSNSLIIYKKFTGFKTRSSFQQRSAEKLRTVKTYSGLVTPGARKRLIKAVELLVQTTRNKRIWVDNPNGGKMPFQLAFTTLTIHSPGVNICGKEAHKKLLAPFLQWLRRSHDCYLYIWKAELQERGQLHYHLLLGSFVHYEAIRKKWNDLQRVNGYLDSYFNEHGHYDAPSTEIKNPMDKEDIAGYLIKEISKNKQNVQTIGGKVWDCSMNLKELTHFETNADNYRTVIDGLVRDGFLLPKYMDNCTILKANFLDKEKSFYIPELLQTTDHFLYEDHLSYIRTFDVKKVVKPPDVVKPPPKVYFRPQMTLFSSS